MGQEELKTGSQVCTYACPNTQNGDLEEAAGSGHWSGLANG